jgi:hypothetical protein
MVDIGIRSISNIILGKKTDDFLAFVFVGGCFLGCGIFLCLFILFIELFDLAD